MIVKLSKVDVLLGVCIAISMGLLTSAICSVVSQLASSYIR